MLFAPHFCPTPIPHPTLDMCANFWSRWRVLLSLLLTSTYVKGNSQIPPSVIRMSISVSLWKLPPPIIPWKKRENRRNTTENKEQKVFSYTLFSATGLKKICASVAKRRLKFSPVGPLNDLVAQSHVNNLGTSSKVRTTFPKWPLCVTNQFQENRQKRFVSEI